MPEIFVSIKQKVTDFWSNLDKSQKIRAYIISAILIAAISTTILLMTKSEYIPLISSSDSKEIGEMTKVLDDKKIPYKVTDDRKSISVDKKNNDKAQAALVQQGYPKSSGMTFDDAFNKIKINSTESDKKKLWDEYMAKNLGTKLKMLDNVENADVTLVMPQQSIFITGNQQQTKATASVVVKTKSDLTPKQVDGIVKMVASSVENLDPKDVTVVDTNGNVLTSDQTTAQDGTSYQYEMTLKKKSELEKNLRDMFNGRFSNFEGVRVAVNPVLDFSKQKSTSNELFIPDGMTSGAVVSRKDSKETMTNGTQGGAPGVQSNPGTGTVPSYQTGNNGNSNYDKSDLTENFDYTKKQTDSEKAIGDVIPDKTTGAITLLYGDQVKDASGLTPQFLQQIKDIASNATGIPANNFSVSTLQVNPATVPTPTLQETVSGLIQKYGLFAILALLIIGIIIALIPKKQKVILEQPALAEVAAAAAPVQPIMFKKQDEPELPEIQVDDSSEVKKQITKFVKENPDAVAQLLRNWLSDDWD